MEIGRVPLALLVVVGLGACGTTGAGLLESDARIIWEQAPSWPMRSAKDLFRIVDKALAALRHVRRDLANNPTAVGAGKVEKA